MINNIDFFNVKPSIYLLLFLLLTTLSIGFMFVLISYPTLFFNLDYLRLIVLSFGITLPVLLANTIPLIFARENNEHLVSIALFGFMISFFVLIVSLLLSKFLIIIFNFRNGFLCLCIPQTIMSIILGIIMTRSLFKKRRKLYKNKQ